MTEPAHLDFFLGKMHDIKNLFKNELHILGLSSIRLVDGFDFDDEELLTVLGKSTYKSDDEMYAEMVRVFRANPLNKKPVPKGFNEFMKPILQGRL